MESLLQFLALCHDGLVRAGGLASGLPVALFLAGLAGSAVHCAGMCGPFVLGQVAADAGAATQGYGEWRRLAGAALAPYHLGRLTTYSGLGGIAGGVTAVFASSPFFAWISGALLTGGALFMLLQAWGLAATVDLPTGGVLRRLAGVLSASRRPIARYGLGVTLGFLPCGLVYGALGVAAGSGSPSRGAVAMAAFALGTMPALIAVGWGGMLARRRLRVIGRWVFVPTLLLNATIMLALAGERIVSAAP